MARVAGLALAGVLVACSGTPSDPPSRTPAPEALTFAVKGDWGLGGDAQRAITAQMCQARQTAGFDVVVTTGDNFYEPDGQATERTYVQPERCLTGDADHTWRATWGNHDVRGTSTGSTLGAQQRYYAWSEGGVDFFMLDSNTADDPRQREWLDEELRASDARVKIAVFHHPPFTAGDRHPPDDRVARAWVPLFEEHGVSLVLTGHQHIYEHHERNGIHYVVTGGGGAELYGCGARTQTLVRCIPAYHFLLVRVEASTIEVEAIGRDGGRVDAFAFEL